jgi:hypothetical protein
VKGHRSGPFIGIVGVMEGVGSIGMCVCVRGLELERKHLN